MFICAFGQKNRVRLNQDNFNSMFISHGKADDLLDHYSEAVKDLDSSRTWQIGMDGPNVNVAFHKKLIQ